VYQPPPKKKKEETHNIPFGVLKRIDFLVGIRWLGGRGLHTTRSIALTFLGVLFNLSHLYDFVAGLIACRLIYFMSAERKKEERR